MELSINKEYKDRLFKKLFGAPEYKENLLSLYNALNHTDYTDPEALEINTIEDFLYMGMKNDVSCVLDGSMLMAEHQSTFSPNMPIRGFIYFGQLYRNIIDLQSPKIYGRKLLKLPTPKYYVLYNGEEDQPDEVKFRLSDAFIRADESGEFEWTATMLNINYGHNEKLLNACKVLKEYAILIARIREYLKRGSSPEEAVDKAVTDCINEGILSEFLREHRTEVLDVLFTEYNEAEVMQGFKEEAFEDGMEKGIEKGREEINALNQWLITEDRMDDLKRSATDPQYQIQLLSEMKEQSKSK